MSDVTTKTQSGEKSEEKPAEEEPVSEKSEEKPAEEKPVSKTSEEKPAEEKPASETSEEKPAEADAAQGEDPASDTTPQPAEANVAENGDEVVDEVEIEPTSDEPLSAVPEGKLPDDPEPPEEDPEDGDPSDMIDQPESAEMPVLDGAGRPEANDFTQTDAPPELIDPYDSVDTTNPWDNSSDDVDARWDQDSLTDIGVEQVKMGDWDVYNDNSTGDTYTSYGDGTFAANVGGESLTGDEAAAAFQKFVDTKLLTPEQYAKLEENSYKHEAAGDSSGGSSTTPPGPDTGDGDAGDSDAAGGSAAPAKPKTDPADLNGDGEVTWTERLANSAKETVKGWITPEKETPEGTTAADTKVDTESTDSGTAEPSHPGWGGGDHGGSSMFDPLKNQPGRTDPRDPGNVDPHEDGYGDGGGDASTVGNDDLKQPAGPDAEPSGNGTFRPAPEPIDFGPDHVDPIGSGPYDNDPINTGSGTVSLDTDEPDLYETPIEMADNSRPDLDVDLFD